MPNKNPIQSEQELREQFLNNMSNIQQAVKNFWDWGILSILAQALNNTARAAQQFHSGQLQAGKTNAQNGLFTADEKVKLSDTLLNGTPLPKARAAQIVDKLDKKLEQLGSINHNIPNLQTNAALVNGQPNPSVDPQNLRQRRDKLDADIKEIDQQNNNLKQGVTSKQENTETPQARRKF